MGRGPYTQAIGLTKRAPGGLPGERRVWAECLPKLEVERKLSLATDQGLLMLLRSPSRSAALIPQT